MKSMQLTHTFALGLMVLAALILTAIPTLSYAATYAYVNNSGEVMTVEAATWSIAIATAPNIDDHSGVLLVNGAEDSAMVGDRVSGM